MSHQELQRKLEKCNRSTIKSIWYEVLHEDSDNDLPNAELKDLVVKLLTRGDADKIQVALSRAETRSRRLQVISISCMVGLSVLVGALIAVAYLFRPRTVDVKDFFRTWEETSDTSMEQIYIKDKPHNLIGLLTIDLSQSSNGVYVLIPPGWDGIPTSKELNSMEKERSNSYRGPVRVTPRVDTPPEPPAPGSKLKFTGRIDALNSMLGVFVIDAYVEVIPP